jgi:hypothetical protein
LRGEPPRRFPRVPPFPSVSRPSAPSLVVARSFSATPAVRDGVSEFDWHPQPDPARHPRSLLVGSRSRGPASFVFGPAGLSSGIRARLLGPTRWGHAVWMTFVVDGVGGMGCFTHAWIELRVWNTEEPVAGQLSGDERRRWREGRRPSSPDRSWCERSGVSGGDHVCLRERAASAAIDLNLERTSH